MPTSRCCQIRHFLIMTRSLHLRVLLDIEREPGVGIHHCQGGFFSLENIFLTDSFSCIWKMDPLFLIRKPSNGKSSISLLLSTYFWIAGWDRAKTNYLVQSCDDLRRELSVLQHHSILSVASSGKPNDEALGEIYNLKQLTWFNL